MCPVAPQPDTDRQMGSPQLTERECYQILEDSEFRFQGQMWQSYDLLGWNFVKHVRGTAVLSVHLHLDVVTSCGYLPHDYVSEIFQRKEHIPKIFCSVKSSRWQDDNSPDHREFVEKR